MRECDYVQSEPVASPDTSGASAPSVTRTYWLETMLSIGNPVLDALSRRELKQRLPNEFHVDRSEFAPLEALGRLACGIAPWLELQGLPEAEERLREQALRQLLHGIDSATDPASPDAMNFTSGGQPLVDAAFLAHALLRSPTQLAGGLSPEAKARVIAALRQTRQQVPHGSNWLFFSAMVEAGLSVLSDETYDRMRVAYAVHMFMKWYKGDGAYGDGEPFHWDYYNSFVIQPMLVDLVRTFGSEMADLRALEPLVLERAQRYAGVLERMISPEGTYPPIGRSLTYRFGAFQLLSQAALQHFLPEELQPAQVRGALTAVIRRTMNAPGTLDAGGWLRPGLNGHQPSLAEGYINTGSLYLCTAVFLPLGLAPTDPFWSSPDAEWTSRIIFGGGDHPADHAISR